MKKMTEMFLKKQKPQQKNAASIYQGYDKKWNKVGCIIKYYFPENLARCICLIAPCLLTVLCSSLFLC